MILVTGASGLLGSNLLFELSKSNENIKAIYRDEQKIKAVQKLFLKLDPENGEQLFKKTTWIQCDVLDIITLKDVMKDVKIIYHCAALVSFRRRDFSLMMKTNAQGTANIVNLALEEKIEKLCYVSSTAAVGKVLVSNTHHVVETNKWTQSNKTSGYSISKYTAEKEVWRGMEEGLNTVIINPSVIFGPGSWDESSLTIFRTISNGLKFYTKGANAFVDVRDVVNSMISLTNSDVKSQRFLCTGTNIHFKDLFHLIAQELNKKTPYIYANRFMCEIAWRLSSLIAVFKGKSTLTKESVQSSQSFVEYDCSKIKKQLNFEFHKLPETIKYTVQNKI
ncbi:MAG: NAD-dependent epimerase/dehydratase family protein [Bacteroidota bacterium]